MLNRHLFSSRIEPACTYCKVGLPTQDKLAILCPRRGVCDPHNSCGKFIYAPLRRIPRRPRPMMEFDPSDFAL